MRKQPLIFYGAGEFARLLFESSGFKPTPHYELVAFADGAKEKHGTRFFDLPIMSLENAIKKYPDAAIKITLGKKKKREIMALWNDNYKSRVINPPVKTRLGCWMLNNKIELLNSGFACCCWNHVGQNLPPHVQLLGQDKYSETVDNFLSMHRQIIEGVNDPNIDTPCDDCICLKPEEYHPPEKPFQVKIISWSENNPCNFRCIYCSEGRHSWKREDKDKYVDIFKLYETLRERNLLSDQWELHYGAGELGVLPDYDKFFQYFGDVKLLLPTNASVYMPEVYSKLQQGTVDIITSIDAGTAETFRIMRGVDAYDKVKENLKKYCIGERKGTISVKYIIYPEKNDNDDDAEGFAKLCNDLKPDKAILDHNYGYDVKKYYNSKTKAFAQHLFEMLNDYGIKIEVRSFIIRDLLKKETTEGGRKDNPKRKTPIIFYGAGEFARLLFESTGYNPAPQYETVCFADNSPQKIGSVFLNTPVMSVDEALKKYPDAVIQIALGKKKKREVMSSWGEELQRRVINPPQWTKLGCWSLNNKIQLLDRGMACCCWDNSWQNVPPVVHLKDYDNYDDMIEAFWTQHSAIMLGVNDPNVDTPCDDCVYLNENNFKEAGLPFKMSVLGWTENGVCNFNCTYCIDELHSWKEVDRDKYVDIFKLYDLLKQKDRIAEEWSIHFGAGELGVHPDKKKYFEYFRDVPVVLPTNASVYMPEIHDKLIDGTAEIIVSIDAGTEETFKKIRRTDMYNRVIDNLKKYSTGIRRGKIALKYIVFPGENDNNDDAIGFVTLCTDLSPDEVIVDHHYRCPTELFYNDNTVSFAIKLVEGIRLHGLNLNVRSPVIRKIINGDDLK